MPVDIRLTPKPVFRVTVAYIESGLPLMATVQIRKRGTEENRYSLSTDSVSGGGSQMLDDTLDCIRGIKDLQKIDAATV